MYFFYWILTRFTAGNGLKVVSTMSVGYGTSILQYQLGCDSFQLYPTIRIDHLDMQTLSSRGIRVGYTPEVLSDAGTPLII